MQFSNRTWAALLVAVAVGAVLGAAAVVWGITAAVASAAAYFAPAFDKLSS